MTENIVEIGSKHVHDVQDINKNLIEKTLRMRCLAYLSHVKSNLLVETISDMNASRKELARLSSTLQERTQEAEKQKQIIEEKSRELEKSNRSLEIERNLLKLKVEERIKLEKQATEILNRSQKMDALGKLSGGIAHDYNNMLNIIIGYAEMLELALKDQPKLSGYAHEILHASQRGAKLTKKLLDISRKNITEASSVNINHLILEMKQVLEKTLTARITFTLELDDNLWDIWIDSNDLEDALLNMTINAMHAIDGVGQLSIRTLNQTLNTLDAHVLQLNKGDYVQVCVTDTGCGMDDTSKQRIFEPFYTTKGEKGTGLGLSQVYGFVERSGGAIKVYSEIDKGTSFVFYFPRHQKNMAAENANNDIAAKTLRGDETILVVDDELALLDMSSEIVRQKGYRVLSANTAAQAIDLLKKEKVDLLLSDIVMPEMDGYQLAAFVQTNYPETKIQLVSGFSDNRHENMIDEGLYQDLIYKPYNSQELLKKIRALLDDGKKTPKARETPGLLE